MRRGAIILTCAAITAIAIGIFIFSSGRGDFSDNSSAAVVVPFTKLARGSQSVVERRVNYFITSSSQFSELWKMVNATGTPPEVDFNTHAVIAVFAGKEFNSAIEVAKVEDTDARLVSITLAKPSEDCASKQQATTPYEIVAVPATLLPLTHKDIVTTLDCSR